jgi:hypothetical protein
VVLNEGYIVYFGYDLKMTDIESYNTLDKNMNAPKFLTEEVEVEVFEDR